MRLKPLSIICCGAIGSLLTLASCSESMSSQLSIAQNTSSTELSSDSEDDWTKPVTTAQADCFVWDYYNNSDAVLLGKFQNSSYIKDPNLPAPHINEDRSLKSWFINADALEKALKKTNGKKISGLRFYPAMNTAQVEVVDGGVPSTVDYKYHTLVFFPTQFKKTGSGMADTAHVNVPTPFEYVSPCPNFCSSFIDTVGKQCN